VIRQRGLWPETYALALEVAECAADKEPENGAIQVTLGAALFRAGRYEEALASLERGSLLVGDGGPIDCAFMALTSHALGDDHAADRARHRLHDRMRDPDHASVVSLVGLQNEVEQALMGVEFE
jgi:predicted Zn-dependent protease